MEAQESGAPFRGLKDAVVTLQTPSSSLNERINALRFLKRHVERATDLDEQTRSNINQLVLDNVLNIVLSEDRTTDLRMRQLLRTECFLMLASLLGSQTLFRGIDQKLVKLAAEQSQNQNQRRAELDMSPSGETKQQVTPPGRDEDDYDDYVDELEGEDLFDPSSSSIIDAGGDESEASLGNSSSKSRSKKSGWVMPSPSQSGRTGRRPPTSPTMTMTSKHSPGAASSSSSNDDLDVSIMSASAASAAVSMGRADLPLTTSKSSSGLDLSVLRPTIAKAPRLLLRNKKLRPRPAVIFNSEAEFDAFVPGVDPTNWQEQDRRLGYQKPRMWFPSAAGSLDRKMVPVERNKGSEPLTSDRIVHEYLQLKALLSYVGDLVMPFSGKALTRTAAGAELVAQQGALARPLARLAGVVSHSTHEAATREAVEIWTPLLGAHLPSWAKHAGDDYGKPPPPGASAATEAEEGDGDALSVASRASFASAASATSSLLGLTSAYSASTIRPDPANPRPPAALQKAVLVSKDALRRLLNKEIKGSERTGAALREALHLLTQSDSVALDRELVEGVQERFGETLAEEKRNVDETISAIQTLTRETVRLQYASLPARYLLVIEGKKANPRALVEKLVTIFCKTRRTNLLAMALGIWKLLVVEKERKARTVQYSKAAACFLMKQWVINCRFRQMKKWTKRWRMSVRKIIFELRNAAVLPLQTLYRRWRDRCLIIRKHLAGPYNGPLSDIFLGPWRAAAKFRIPASIRNSRRMFWQAAIQIQTRWRLFFVYRETRERRQKVILLQSVIRMWPKRMQYLRLRKWTIRCQAWMRRTVAYKIYSKKKVKAVVIQKYVRRYLGQNWRWRVLFKMWSVPERRMGAAILIQTRWREFVARRRVRGIIFGRKKRLWAVLVLQRLWYKYKKAYSTFVLMCFLRSSQELDIEFGKFVFNLRRFYAARVVQRRYAVRFFRRNLTAAIRLQCWWRGRLGYSLVDLKRKQLWASRKLHHWARGVLRRKNARVRKIQRVWWNYKQGSLIAHLISKHRRMDDLKDSSMTSRRYDAACVIQAYVRGMWARYWAQRERAARKIQPPLRRFLARQRRKRIKREQNHNKVLRFVHAMTLRLVQRRVKQIVKIHSRMLVKPQKLIRGWLVRRRFAKARHAAHVYGQAVLCIQRAYRRSGAMAEAVATVLAAKRADTNPFRQFSNLHDLLIELRKKCNRLYNYRDPRVGLKLGDFLYRLGLPDLIPMFPKKEFTMFNDLRGIKMQRLLSLHDDWMDLLDKQAKGKGNREAANKKRPKPLEQFKLILDTVKPAYVPRAPSMQRRVASIMCVQDVISPDELGELVFSKFMKKFGETHVAKAHNFSEKMVTTNWIDYNNVSSLGVVTTMRLIDRCLDDGGGGGEVGPRMEEFRLLFSDASEEGGDTKWNKKRVAECASLMQLAYERAIKVIEETPKPKVVVRAGQESPFPEHDPVGIMLECAGHKVASYKRKFGFMRDRFTKEKQRMAKEQAANPNKVTRSHREPHWALPEGRRNRILTVEECLDQPFDWLLRSTDQLDFEFNISVCKLFQQTFDKLVCATMGVQGLKSHWRSNSIRRVANREREKIFLEKTTEEYQHMMKDNHVQRVWVEQKRKTEVVRLFQTRLQEAQERRELVTGLLKWIPRFGWAKRFDADSNAYWEDTLDRGLESTYDMPIYTHAHWKAVGVLQRRTVAFLEAIKERKRLKELEKQRQMALIEEAWLEQLQKSQKKVIFKLNISPNGISAMIERQAAKLEAAAAAAVADDDAGSVASVASVASVVSIGTIGTLASKVSKGSQQEVALSSSEAKADHSIDAQGGAEQASEQAEAGAGSESDEGEAEVKQGAASSSEKDSRRAPTPQGGDADKGEELGEVSLDDVQRHLPWRLSFNPAPKLISGMWALLRTPHKPQPLAGYYPFPAYTTNDYGMKEALKARAKQSGNNKGRGGKSRGGGGGGRLSAGESGEEEQAEGRGSKSRGSTRGGSRGDNRGNSRGGGSKGGTRLKPSLPVDEGDSRGIISAGEQLPPYTAVSAGYSYEVVVLFNLHKLRTRMAVSPASAFASAAAGGVSAPEQFVWVDKDVCCCRNIKGVRYNDVDLSRIFVMNMERGLGVECRHKRSRAFYRGVVSNVTMDHLGDPRYTIRYDDGEVETGVTRDMLRPSAPTLDRWFDERSRLVKDAALMLRRKEHFRLMREERLSRLQIDAHDASRSFALHWMWTSGSTPSDGFKAPDSLVASRAAAAAAVAAAAAEAEAAAAAEMRAGMGGRRSMLAYSSSTQSPALSAPSDPSLFASTAAPAKLSVAWLGLLECANRLAVLDKGVRCQASYNFVPFRLGWSVLRESTLSSDVDVVFVNSITKARTTSMTEATYRPSHDYYARKLQSIWAVRKARKAFSRLIWSEPVEELVNSTIERCKKTAFVGYGNEGVTTLHLVRRCGFSDVANALERKFKLYPRELAALSMDSLAALPPDRFVSVGIGAEDSKSLKTLQKWWLGTSPVGKEKALRFINWFDASTGRAAFYLPTDDRPLSQVLLTGESVLLERFSKLFPQSLVRCEAGAKKAVTDTLFPITFAQVDAYLRKYGDSGKVDLVAKDNIGELVGKVTTSTWQEEREAYLILLTAAKRLAVLYGNMGLKSVSSRVASAIDAAQSLHASAGASKRLVTSTGGSGPGVEGRAAHLLRVKVFAFLQLAHSGARLLQKRLRGWVRKKTFGVMLQRRYKSVRMIQRWARGCVDRRLARRLRLAQQADWEQLWDPNRELVYFYNHKTRKATYLQPQGPFRPLVRDRRSQALMQAWPFLDQHRAPEMAAAKAASAIRALAPHHASAAPALAYCVVCQVRRCVRMCSGCVQMIGHDIVINGVVKSTKKEPHPTPYCFSCFSSAHGENTDMAHHEFTVPTSSVSQQPEQGEEPAMLCVICDELATRKCLGILDDHQIDELCAELARSKPERWAEVLKKANVAGERKLGMILEDIVESRSEASVHSGLLSAAAATTAGHGGDDQSPFSSPAGSPSKAPSGGPSIASVSGSTIYSGAGHTRKDDYQISPAQLQKLRQALERTRAECDETYCDNCYKELHSGGKRGAHRWLGFMPRAAVCAVCTRSPATDKCQDCGEQGLYCNSCFRVFHSVGRKRKHRRSLLLEEIEDGQEYCQECSRRAAVSWATCNNEAAPDGKKGVSSFMDAMEAQRGIGASTECGKRCCEACFECIHKPRCDQAVLARTAARALEAAKKEAQRLARDPAAAALQASLAVLNQLCVSCGEVADQKCVQCGDAYCSRSWMVSFLSDAAPLLLLFSPS